MSNLAPLRVHRKSPTYFSRTRTAYASRSTERLFALQLLLVVGHSVLPRLPFHHRSGSPSAHPVAPRLCQDPCPESCSCHLHCLTTLRTTEEVHKTREREDSNTAQGGLFGLLMPGYPSLGMPLGKCSDFCWKCCSIGFHGACTGFRVWLYRSGEGDPETDSRSIVSPGAFWTPRRVTPQP